MKKKHILIIIMILMLIIVFGSNYGWRVSNKSCQVSSTVNTEINKNLKTHVYKLSHEIGERNISKYDKLEEAAKYISEKFTSYGYNVDFQYFNVNGKIVKNIIAEKRNVNTGQGTVIIGAHYDTHRNPGADDNASGVAGLLELSRLMANNAGNTNLKFIAFVNEEPPYFKTKDMGSLVYAQEARSKAENIKGAIILEMIGYYSDKLNSQKYPPVIGCFYPNKANYILIVGNQKSHWLVNKTIDGFKRNTGFPIEKMELGFIPGVDFSDHWSFWKEGYPAIMVTDTAFYRNNNYHKQGDTYEKINYESMAEVIMGLSSAIIELVR